MNCRTAPICGWGRSSAASGEFRPSLGEARTAADLGRRFGPSLTEREVQYLIDREWAVTAEDVLWRRSKLGLGLEPAERAQLESFMAARRREGQAAAPRA